MLSPAARAQRLKRKWADRRADPFPVRVGKRAGDFRKLGSSFAKALRRDLLRAGVRRHECTRPPDAPAMKIREACCPNMVHDPIFSDTATTLRVDFHSFRRAFSTALAETGVNAQTAMRLASHADEKTHMRYVMRTAAMRRIPETVVPKIAALPIATDRGNSRPKTSAVSAKILSDSSGAPGRTRTCDPRLRRPLLYPTELRARTCNRLQLLVFSLRRNGSTETVPAADCRNVSAAGGSRSKQPVAPSHPGSASAMANLRATPRSRRPPYQCGPTPA